MHLVACMHVLSSVIISQQWSVRLCYLLRYNTYYIIVRFTLG